METIEAQPRVHLSYEFQCSETQCQLQEYRRGQQPLPPAVVTVDFLFIREEMLYYWGPHGDIFIARGSFSLP